MVQQVTKGIKISVETTFEGTFYKDYKIQYAFGYKVSIENQGKNTVQLSARHWIIKDALNHTTIVSGPGVIGQKPILKPGESHTYSSGCLLTAPFGAMSGHYDMVDFATTSYFKVNIPTFKLSAPFAIN
ncbi:cobalt transporter [Mangrovimonas yunxiaonensis]|uniref:Cobalt transporter n=1 Tax=Mangrovimonas yunxiaonensis TaxID=1197477 RepID=A0A084TI43_9FLAO|nr:Co2+/Mg2+ efflux protein ApaG [Mangrovimonas yunxiaonensis]KFB00379.1 cobalt transporter [Mangrovimonas yunxiaonensis]MBR9757494.1 Co2+/Mg2+ efflux protein ApaG [Algicola sp.]GGH35101.1 Co2+/Mg2+ efflux protein ApaG [Mangrovimonas yunxiaonensis]